MRRLAKGAAFGAGAALVWAAAEPALQRIFGTSYSDVRLAGKLLTRGRAWPVAGLAAHVATGSAFGAAFAVLGGRGWRAGLAVAELETALLWPLSALVERHHPDCISGRWPRLLTNGRIFAHSAVGHALYGVLLGKGLEREEKS